MKTTWYGVCAEFYDYGEVKANITTTQAVKKPNNQFEQLYRMTAFKIWLTNLEAADTLLEMISDGEAYIDGLISLYEDCLPLEGRAA